ncbi:Eco29kI family restriction endonuclease [Corynebacterium xerosis]|uniref:Eco29kI family restriction endonuclease n=1 Tax=Corynebacterium xerosis TaxID=1725 RepID=A0A6B8TQZ5_9CORY|nr:Eco29kI family restriction endonuclease [Corynebacterium xerosis]QGS35151.1 Eco29kI family restriction endonuclease [Corynebacterium xerosis]
MKSFGDRSSMNGAGQGRGLVIVEPDEDRSGEEIHRVAAEHEVLRVTQRKIADQAGGHAYPVGADGRGEAIGVGQRDRVIECARPDAAGSDRMALKRGDQRQLFTAGGAVAIGKGGRVLPNSLDDRVLGDVGNEGVRVQVIARTVEHDSDDCSNAVRASIWSGGALRVGDNSGIIKRMGIQGQPSYAREFKLSITRALGDQLFEAMDATGIAPLTQENINSLEPRPGVYELHNRIDGEWRRVYVGKASKSLPQRLSKHRFKLSGRENIKLEDMAFKCAYVDEDFDSSAPEKMLIARHRKTGDVVWNNNGFGNNDPGKQRDTSLVKANHFDSQYPVNLEISYAAMDLGIVDGSKAYDAVSALKINLPYLLRFDKNVDKVLEGGVIRNLSDRDMEFSVGEWLERLMHYFPDGWQLTVLPGYLILYPESREYLSARRYWRTVDGEVVTSVGSKWAGLGRRE